MTALSINAATMQIVADVFQLRVVLPLESESAALGVALQAAAVHRGSPVAEYIAAGQPPMADARKEGLCIVGAACCRFNPIGELL